MWNEETKGKRDAERTSLAEREASVAQRERDIARREQELRVMEQRRFSGGMAPSRWSESHQDKLSREEMLRQGTDSPLYRPGTGSYYSETFERPTGDAAPQSSFGAGSYGRVGASRRASDRPLYNAGTGSYYSESFERPTGDAAPEAYFGEGSPRFMREKMSRGTGEGYQPRLSREEMLRQGTDSPLYRPGTGSYYSETFERPTGDAAPQSSFGAGTSRSGTGAMGGAPGRFGQGVPSGGPSEERETIMKAAYAAGAAAGAEAARQEIAGKGKTTAAGTMGQERGKMSEGETVPVTRIQRGQLGLDQGTGRGRIHGGKGP